ncbi:MAG: hypothetical protein FJW34_08985 [Acidobacteria bacterium]|nr:hypothetical protein [Acidobacteriota bacterium]
MNAGWKRLIPLGTAVILVNGAAMHMCAPMRTAGGSGRPDHRAVLRPA